MHSVSDAVKTAVTAPAISEVTAAEQLKLHGQLSTKYGGYGRESR